MAALSRRQDGVLEILQLRSLGFSDDRVALLVAQGRLRHEHRGVYLDALVKPTTRAGLLAALLALGDGAYLSRRTALALYGVRPQNLRATEVTLVANHTPRHLGIVVHRTTVEPLADELRTRDGLRVSSPALALVEVAGRETNGELDRLVAELDRRRALDLAAIDAATDRRRGLRGISRLQAAVARYRPSDAADLSGFERALAAWLAEHPEIPEPQRNVKLGPWELDFFWPAQRLVVETDGDRYHRTPAETERDRVKDAWLQRRGLRILRVTEFRFAHDRAGILGDIVGLMRVA